MSRYRLLVLFHPSYRDNLRQPPLPESGESIWIDAVDVPIASKPCLRHGRARHGIVLFVRVGFGYWEWASERVAARAPSAGADN